MIYPDYGTHLLGQGSDGILLSHYDVPINRISVVEPGLFTVTTNLVVGGVEFAASFDLSHEMVVRIARAERGEDGSEALRRLAALAPGQSLDLEHAWIAKVITATLGSPQHAAKEVFVPLVVVDIK